METRNNEEEYEYEAPLFAPTRIFIILLLVGLTMVFLFLTLSYLYNRIEQGIAPVKVPLIFVLNTLVLIASSYMMHEANKAYQSDNTEKYKQSLLITIILTLLFMVLQVVGWTQLIAQNAAYFSASDNAQSYLQIISGLHFFHVLSGLPFIILFYWVAKKRMVEPVSVLIYFSDPKKLQRLRLLTLYWHFLDILWIYLVLFFFVNSLV